MGAEVAVLPWDADVAWGEFDGALIRTPWDYHLGRAAEFQQRIEHIGRETRLQNSAAVVRWSLDKRYLRALADHGVAMLPTAWIEPGSTWSAEQIGTWLDERRFTRGFLKPVVGANAVGTLRFERNSSEEASRHLLEEAARHLARDSSGDPGHGWMLQPYLEAVETLGEVSAVLFDGEWSHGGRKIPAGGDYRVQDDHGATDRPEEFSPENRAVAMDVVRIAERLLGLDQPLLYARVDFLEDAAGSLWLTELELVEPSLFFRHHRPGATALARAFLRRLRSA